MSFSSQSFCHSNSRTGRLAFIGKAVFPRCSVSFIFIVGSSLIIIFFYKKRPVSKRDEVFVVPPKFKAKTAGTGCHASSFKPLTLFRRPFLLMFVQKDSHGGSLKKRDLLAFHRSPIRWKFLNCGCSILQYIDFTCFLAEFQ